MTKIKFERNRKTPSDQEILKHKNFDSVLKGYQSGMESAKWFQSAKLWGGLIATACLAGIGFYLWNNSTIEKAKTAQEESAPAEVSAEEKFNEDLSTIYNSNAEHFNFNPEKDTILITNNGSIISIPAYAFDTECKKVKLVVNEIDDPIKMFQSKIDMSYDSAGTKYHFESAGMIEIKAFDDKDPIDLKVGKEVSIALVTNTVEPTYNLYRKTPGNWNYLGDANTLFQPVSFSEKSADLESHFTQEQFSSKNEKKVKIGKADPSYPTFDVDVSMHLELKEFAGLVFQVDPKEKDFQEDYYLVSWEKIELEKENLQYFINLERGGLTKRFKVKPVMNQTDYKKHLQKNQKKSSYYDQMSQRKKDFTQEFKSQNLLFDYDQNSRNYQVSSLLNEEVKYQVASKTRRVFSVSQLGILNCDHVLPESFKQKVALAELQFKDDGKSFTPQVTYVIIPGINTLFTFNSDGLKYYAKKGETKVWIIQNGKIGIVEEVKKKKYQALAYYDVKEGVRKIGEYCSN